MAGSTSHAGRSLHALSALVAVVFVVSCGSAAPPEASGTVSAPIGNVNARAEVVAAGPVCGGTDAHDKHAAQGYDCATCHVCPGTLGFSLVTFPGGGSTANGTITENGSATTCSVACHSPLGAAPQTVAWNAGPLQCTSCHSNVVPTSSASIVSSHVVGATTFDSPCRSCHDQSQHTRGQVLILNGDGTSTSGTCVGCHSGQGQTLGGETPPLLVGWTDTVGGDFHGAREGTCRFDRLDATGQRSVGRGAYPCPTGQPQPPSALRITSRWWYASGTSGPWAWTCDIETVDENGLQVGAKLLRQPCPTGTFRNTTCNNPAGDPDCYPVNLVSRGFGGELRPPFVRGEGPLPCAACHDFHASENAFLFASTVNGVAIPAGVIDRAGVGAQVLCNACHAGDRHEICKTCHREVWTSDGEYWWFEGAVVDPVPDGSACFYCHGHEGILHMRDMSPAYPESGHPFGLAGSDKDDACSHCHSGWRPPPTEYLAPAFPWGSPPVISGVTATTATVSWQTNENATSYVEYGVGTAGYVAGNDVPVRDHSVTLTGLTPNVAYVWRVRTSDAFRNVTRTALQTFTTPGAAAVPKPDVAPVSLGVTVGTHEADVALVWYPVVAPSGTVVEYEVQLASDPTFTHLVNGSMSGPGVPGSTVCDSGWIGGAATTVGGKPALSYPARVTNIPQDECNEIVPAVYYWRVRAREQQGNVSEWSVPGAFGAFAGDPWC